MIAEIFLEAPLFTLSDLVKYRNGEYSPAADIDQIECPHMAAMVRQMVQLDPSSRPQIATFLDSHHSGEGRAFPSYFHDFAHAYISDIIAPTQTDVPSALYTHLPTIDGRIERLYQDFDKIQTFLQFNPGTDVTSQALSSTETTSSSVKEQIITEHAYAICLPNLPPQLIAHPSHLSGTQSLNFLLSHVLRHC